MGLQQLAQLSQNTKPVIKQPALVEPQQPLIANAGDLLNRYGAKSRLWRNSGGMHYGTDYLMPVGTELKIPPGSWEVVRAGDPYENQVGYGNSILVKNTKTGDMLRYSHMSQIGVRPGEKLTGGQKVGLSGGQPGTRGAGNSTDPHLDIEYKTPAGVTKDIMKSPYKSYLPKRVKVPETPKNNPAFNIKLDQDMSAPPSATISPQVHPAQLPQQPQLPKPGPAPSVYKLMNSKNSQMINATNVLPNTPLPAPMSIPGAPQSMVVKPNMPESDLPDIQNQFMSRPGSPQNINPGTPSQVQQSIQKIGQPASVIKPNTYTVKPGDTLWGIAQKTTGSGSNWKQLGYKGTPTKLQVGTLLKIPTPKTVLKKK